MAQQSILTSVLLAVICQVAYMQDCIPEDFSWRTPEKDIIKFISNAIEGQTQNFSVNCITELLERSYFDSALRIYEDYFLLNGIDIDDDLIARTLQISRKSLDNFFNIHNKHYKTVQQWEPVFQWVQSNNTILFQVKFSHRIDAPACLNTKIEDVKITENKVYLSAKGVISHSPTHFLMDLDLFDKINVDKSKWRSESVGTLVFELRKSTQGLWKRLTVEQRKINIWWEMRSHFRRDMDDYFNMIEEEAEGKKKQKPKKKEPVVIDL